MKRSNITKHENDKWQLTILHLLILLKTKGKYTEMTDWLLDIYIYLLKVRVPRLQVSHLRLKGACPLLLRWTVRVPETTGVPIAAFKRCVSLLLLKTVRVPETTGVPFCCVKCLSYVFYLRKVLVLDILTVRVNTIKWIIGNKIT